MAVVLSNIRTGVLGVDPSHVVDGAPLVALFADAVFDNSYATGGELFSPTLDGFMSDVTQFFASDNSGIALEFSDNATLASAKLKALQAEGSHTHTIAAAQSQAMGILLQEVSNVIGRSPLLIKTGTHTPPNPYVAGGTTLNLDTATDLDGSGTTAFDGVPFVATEAKAIAGDYQPRYIPHATDPALGKIALTVESTGVEVGSVDATAMVVKWTAIGKQSTSGALTLTGPSTTAGNTADEIASGQDISAVTFSVMIVGKPKVQS